MRKSKVVTIDAEGRDKGKTFQILEKSAYDGEKWATRALLALGKAGVDIPEDAIRAGALGILLAGLQGFQQMRFEDAEPLLEEMLDCITFVPDAGRVDQSTGRPIVRPVMRGNDVNDGDIEELSTLLRLRGEALELHLGFSVTAVLSSLATAVQTSNPPAMSTSPRPVGRRSPKAEPAS